ncbi:MAG: phage portal protein [Eubacterium sp.]|nr:phage portal protein [Eubacterium sp.]
MIQFAIDPSNINGFPIDEVENFIQLQTIYQNHAANNQKKQKYYEGKISLDEVNLGIALPNGLRGLQIGCAWGAKTVDVLAARSMFDGFVGSNGNDITELNQIIADNNLLTEYMKSSRDELKYGCTFATLSEVPDIGVKIRFHSPISSAASWDGVKGRIKRGFAIIDTVQDNYDQTWVPTIVNYYTDDATWVLRKDGSIWNAQKYPHKLGRPLMEPLIWNATTDKPFGRSRIKEPIRRLIDGYVRTIANATIGLEFATSPQKYLLGVTDDQYDAIVDNKFKQYVGSILTSTYNPESGQNPSFGQLTQGSITPHVEMLRILATQFSAASGLSVTDTGVVNEANPTSSDAILAQSQTLIAMAEQLNAGNGEALKNIALMALAIKQKKSLDALDDTETDIIAHFKNPAMPSVAITTDAAIKIASVRETFANTDTFLEMIGFDQAEIRRIKAQEQRERGMQVLEQTEEEIDMEEEAEEDITELESDVLNEYSDEVISMLEGLMEE